MRKPSLATSLRATTVILAATLTVASLPAHAGKNSPAPIDYRGHSAAQTQTYSSNVQQAAPARVSTYRSAQSPAQTRSYASNTYSQPARVTQPRQVVPQRPAARVTGTSKATARIEFRYPDQPNVVHGNGAVYRGAQPAARTLSAADAVVASQDARTLVSAPTPQRVAQPQASGPYVNRGFDARAAAAKVAAARIQEEELAPVNVAVVQPQQAMPQGRKFNPVAQPGFDETGLASWYGADFHGQPTANGEIFDMNGLTAAHPTLPLPSLVQVMNPANGREVVVRVNDRGPFEAGRIIDLSLRAAEELGYTNNRAASVRVRYLGAAPVQPTAGQGAIAGEAPIANVNQPLARQPEQLPFLSMDPIPNPPAGQFFVQVGSFSDIGNAQSLSEALSGSMPVEIVPAFVNGADWFRVQVGPLDTRLTADSLRDHLDEQGIANGRVITK